MHVLNFNLNSILKLTSLLNSTVKKFEKILKNPEKRV